MRARAVRLTGCPLRCVWCDTEYAFSGGELLTLADILQRVAGFDCATVCVTGGEPLAQKNCLPLLAALCDAGHSVSLETSGALDIGGVDPRVARIVDARVVLLGQDVPPVRGLGQTPTWLLHDLDWSAAGTPPLVTITRDECCPVLFSPVQGQLDPAQLAQWILDDRLPLRFQLQLHKLLWDNAKGR